MSVRSMAAILLVGIFFCKISSSQQSATEVFNDLLIPIYHVATPPQPLTYNNSLAGGILETKTVPAMDLTTLLVFLLGFSCVSCRSLQPKAAAKSGNDQKSASSAYQTVTGPDDKGNNYIPFQWQVEIIKREYDDYVLPDGTVYRVPHGAVPPHRYKGKGPYDVPYYVFKEDKTHSGEIYGNRPKLVETFDTQALELLLQDWYQEELWSRGYLGNDDKRYPTSQEYYGDYDGGGNSPYAPSEKHEKTHGRNTQPRQKDRKNSVTPSYFMRSFNGTQRWSDRDYTPSSSRTSSQISSHNYGPSSQINHSGKLSGHLSGPRGVSGAIPVSSSSLASRSTSATRNLENINKTPESDINIKPGIGPNVHPFISLFRGGLTRDDVQDSYI